MIGIHVIEVLSMAALDKECSPEKLASLLAAVQDISELGEQVSVTEEPLLVSLEAICNHTNSFCSQTFRVLYLPDYPAPFIYHIEWQTRTSMSLRLACKAEV